MKSIALIYSVFTGSVTLLALAVCVWFGWNCEPNLIVPQLAAIGAVAGCGTIWFIDLKTLQRQFSKDKNFEELTVVALRTAFYGLRKGTVGTVLIQHDDDTSEVEFCDSTGQPITDVESLAVPNEFLKRI